MNLHNRLESRKMLPRHLPGRAVCVSRGAEPCSHCTARPESRQACFTSETASPHDRSQKRDPPQAWTCLAGASAARSPQRVRRGGDAGPRDASPAQGPCLRPRGRGTAVHGGWVGASANTACVLSGKGRVRKQRRWPRRWSPTPAPGSERQASTRRCWKAWGPGNRPRQSPGTRIPSRGGVFHR